MTRMPRAVCLARQRGFTLVELMVALFVMALLSALAWQALDGVLRARDGSREAMDRTVLLSTVLTQWEQDLRAVVDTEAVPPISFDGQTLRLTRRGDDGVMLVAWAVRGGQWQRWVRPGYTRTGELQQGWMASQQLQGNEPGQLTLLPGASTWQIYFNRDGQWSNSQSSGNVVVQQAAPPASPPPTTPPATPPPGGTPAPGGTGGTGGTPPPAPAPAAPQVLRDLLPDAVRLQITLDGKVLTRDIALGPAGSS